MRSVVEGAWHTPSMPPPPRFARPPTPALRSLIRKSLKKTGFLDIYRNGRGLKRVGPLRRFGGILVVRLCVICPHRADLAVC
jgi:hypothetical protein